MHILCTALHHCFLLAPRSHPPIPVTQLESSDTIHPPLTYTNMSYRHILPPQHTPTYPSYLRKAYNSSPLLPLTFALHVGLTCSHAKHKHTHIYIHIHVYTYYTYRRYSMHSLPVIANYLSPSLSLFPSLPLLHLAAFEESIYVDVSIPTSIPLLTRTNKKKGPLLDGSTTVLYHNLSVSLSFCLATYFTLSVSLSLFPSSCLRDLFCRLFLVTPRDFSQ